MTILVNLEFTMHVEVPAAPASGVQAGETVGSTDLP